MTRTAHTVNKDSKKSVFPPWSPATAIVLVFAVYIVGSILGELVSFIYPLSQGWTIDRGVRWMGESIVGRTVQVVAFYGIMVGLLWLFIKKYKVTFWRLGLVRPRLKDLGVSLLAAPVYVLAYATILAVALALFPAINPEQEQQLGFEPGSNMVPLLLTFLSLVILPPLVEELLMRGFLFTSLIGRMRFVWASLITSLIFGLAHLQFNEGQPPLWVAAIDTFVLSLVLCYMRYKTGSIWAGVFLHALKNCVAFLSLFVFHWA